MQAPTSTNNKPVDAVPIMLRPEDFMHASPLRRCPHELLAERPAFFLAPVDMVPQAGRYMLGLVKLSSYNLEPLSPSSPVTSNLSIPIAPLTVYPYDNYAYGSTFVISVRLRSGIPDMTTSPLPPSKIHHRTWSSPHQQTRVNQVRIWLHLLSKCGRASFGCCWDKNPIFCECH